MPYRPKRPTDYTVEYRLTWLDDGDDLYEREDAATLDDARRIQSERGTEATIYRRVNIAKNPDDFWNRGWEWDEEAIEEQP